MAVLNHNVRDRRERVREDFDFLVTCASKGNMAMYSLLRDKSLDEKPNPKLLTYSKATGVFRWLKGRNARKVAGTVCKDGIRIHVAGRAYAAHRLAWLYVRGEWPKALIDHKDLDPQNNKFRNLRPATKAQNCRNQRAKANRSSLKGAAWDASRGKWIATIRTDYGRKNLGRYETPEEAHAVWAVAAKEFHGTFARLR